MTLATERDTPTMWFEGRVYPQSELWKMRKAWFLVPCAFGFVCDKYDDRLAVSCLDYGRCFNNRFEYVQENIPTGERQAYQDIYSYYQRIVAAIQRQDVDAFVKPDGVP